MAIVIDPSEELLRGKLVRRFAIKGLSKMKLEDEEKCAICIEEMRIGEEATSTGCRHRFHEVCMLRWLDRLKPSCPICRGNLIDYGRENIRFRVGLFTKNLKGDREEDAAVLSAAKQRSDIEIRYVG